MAWDGNARTAERLVAQGITTITVPWNLAGVPWQEWSMYQKLVTVRHAAVNKPVTIAVTAKLDDTVAAAKLLVDGVLGRDGNWGTPEVLRLGDSDLEAVIDMGANTEIRKVVVRCFYHQEAGVYPAKLDEILVNP